MLSILLQTNKIKISIIYLYVAYIYVTNKIKIN
jgi:hypothetical protein